MQFVDTYYFANIVHDVVSHPLPYLRDFDGFWGDAAVVRLLPPFPRFTRLHEFASHVIHEVILEELDDVTVDSLVQHPGECLWLEQALNRNQISHQSLVKWLAESGIPLAQLEEAHLREYVAELSNEGAYDELLQKLASEVFFLMFLNRGFLREFNQLMAAQVADVEVEWLSPEHRGHLRADGVLRRVAIPKWVRRAVFFRDRGLCVLCHSDLSGTVSVMPEENFDHMVALANGGVNDVTNIQLLCGSCNRAKGARKGRTSDEYEQWY